MFLNLHLSDWLPWADRGLQPAVPGVYVIAKERPGNVIYIGRTWGLGGLRDRLNAFHRSATTGLKGHAGGVTYHRVFGPLALDLFACVHTTVAINPSENILRPYIEYAERRLIWEYVEKVGKLPTCNSE
ncbi:hypothetical protein [Mesorhizobium sp.]|uniref:hypothetical protein n=1 Tax=Mesorhizobium sp. TaxID=1871066 RepID=UPI0011FF6393|nr:hypothetical protein [Mesorhizobium sp.]TIL38592.1 MAG: hypothetical protein E5Y82_13955 [Mesorhizobium sp.]